MAVVLSSRSTSVLTNLQWDLLAERPSALSFMKMIEDRFPGLLDECPDSKKSARALNAIYLSLPRDGDKPVSVATIILFVAKWFSSIIPEANWVFIDLARKSLLPGFTVDRIGDALGLARSDVRNIVHELEGSL